jgi:hypothetical protein
MVREGQSTEPSLKSVTAVAVSRAGGCSRRTMLLGARETKATMTFRDASKTRRAVRAAHAENH